MSSSIMTFLPNKIIYKVCCVTVAENRPLNAFTKIECWHNLCKLNQTNGLTLIKNFILFIFGHIGYWDETLTKGICKYQ